MSSLTGSPPTHPTAPDGRRWTVLVVVSLGFVMMTLNWFNLSSAFGPIST
jgi:hypothetical protein